MKRRLGISLICVFGLVLLWGGVSSSLSTVAKKAFDDYLGHLSEREYQHFFQFDVKEYQETFPGANASIHTTFSIPALREAFGELPLRAKQLNGPVFINKQGIQFGLARWEVFVDDQADLMLSKTLESTFREALPVAVIRLDFFKQAHISLDAGYFRTGYYDANELQIRGQFDLENGAYEFSVGASEMLLKSQLASLKMPEATLTIQRLATNPSLTAQSNAAVIDIDSPNSQLYYDNNQKKQALSVGSRGSLWLNNDTLSGDWQVHIAPTTSETPSNLLLDLRFRDWLADGFLAYWRQQAEISSLLEQAEWALEDRAETPEEQDFIMSLYADVERIQRQQSQDVLKPMLAYERSELNVNAQYKRDAAVLMQLMISGKAAGTSQQPVLNLEGDVAIQQAALNTHTTAQLDRLGRRFWLRNYETVYEADVAVRNQQLLLNNIRVSWGDFSSELKQLLNDQ